MIILGNGVFTTERVLYLVFFFRASFAIFFAWACIRVLILCILIPTVSATSEESWSFVFSLM